MHRTNLHQPPATANLVSVRLPQPTEKAAVFLMAVDVDRADRYYVTLKRRCLAEPYANDPQ